MTEIQLKENIWVEAYNPIRFTETVDISNGKKSYKIKGLLLPKGKISRNNVLYNWESVEQKYKQLIDKPIMFNHDTESKDALPRGHVTNSWLEEDGWYYEGLVNPQWKEIISALDHGDLKHVSIQLVGDKLKEMRTEENKLYTEAWVGDVVEMSLVPCPGFLQTNISTVMERLNSKAKTENLDTTTNSGEIGTKLVDEEKKEQVTVDLRSELIQFFKANPNPSDEVLHKWAEDKGLNVHEVETEVYKFATSYANLKKLDAQDSEFDANELSKGIEVEKEHTDDLELAKGIAKAHLSEIKDYYSRLARMETEANPEKKVEQIIKAIDENELKTLINDYKK